MHCVIRSTERGERKRKNDLELKSAGFQVLHMMVLGNYICRLYLNVAAITMEISKFLEWLQKENIQLESIRRGRYCDGKVQIDTKTTNC